MIRVLIADDHKVVRQGLRFLLSSEPGIEVAGEAADGRAALDAIRATGPDVVLLDLLMPVLDGYATLAEIKADPALDHVPVIMVSAVPELESVIRCIELGATDYLPKPFSAAVLRARLSSSLAAKRLRDVERDHLRRMAAVVDGEGLADESLRDDVVGRMARRLRRMTSDVADREAALRAEIAALRAEVERARTGTDDR